MGPRKSHAKSSPDFEHVLAEKNLGRVQRAYPPKCMGKIALKVMSFKLFSGCFPVISGYFQGIFRVFSGFFQDVFPMCPFFGPCKRKTKTNPPPSFCRCREKRVRLRCRGALSPDLLLLHVHFFKHLLAQSTTKAIAISTSPSTKM